MRVEEQVKELKNKNKCWMQYKGEQSMSIKSVLIKALEDKYNAQISEADATIKIYFENSVGIGEHPQHVDEVDKLIEKIANAEEKLIILKEFYNDQ